MRAPQACRLCGSSDVRRWFAKAGTEYYICRRCGLQFTAAVDNPNLDLSIEQYEKSYLQYLDVGPSDEANHKALYDWLRQHAALEGGVLDVGCGGGKWVRYLRRQGIDAVGIEPSTAIYERFLQSESDIFTLGDIEALVGTGSRYPVITAFDVLEHVPQPGLFLEALVQLLTPSGRLFISTPDGGSVTARLMGRYWYHYNQFHLSVFSERSLKRAVEQSGLHVVSADHRSKYFSVGYVVRYLREFVLHQHTSGAPSRLDRLALPLNTFDIVYLCVERKAAVSS
jgi:2-polyprenyl-3-methyl-5-hydroxy-6-metoxy-1,4-benzoquinol methylase